MGCGSSKAEEPPLVALCRERRELIRAAAEHRFVLAAAHAAYFRALGRVGDALHRFVQEELVAVAPASPVLTLPPSEGKGKAKAKIERSEGESHGGGPVGASASSFVSISRSHSDDSHLHLPSDDESEEITGESSDIGGGSEDSERSFPHHPFYGAPIPNYHYMKSASTVSSTTVYQNSYPTWSNTAHVGYGYYGYPVYSAPMDPMQPHAHDEHFYQNPPQREDKPSDPPPPPPPADGSAWDFFNPFDSYEQMIPGYLHGNYGVGSVTSSPNSSEVREKEGIPDLEEETEQESVIAPVKERKGADKDAAGSVSGERGSNVAAMEQEAIGKGDAVAPEVKEDSQDISSVSKVEEDEMEKNTKKKTVIFEDRTSLVTDDSKPSKENALSAHGTRNVMEVVTEIKEQFESAANCGKEVSEILEVGKLPILHGINLTDHILAVILSRILDPAVPPVRPSSQPSFTSSQHPASRSLKVKKADRAAWGNMDIDPGKLSSTLEKLYIWEKKLHKNVKEEERLRDIYEREWKQLKALDESGGESWQIDSTQASIRNLVTKLNIVIRSANHISSRIHKIRDEELRPQLTELIQGLLKMWRFVLDCHHKQFQAVVESESQNFVARTGGSVAKATIELEVELLNWCACFSNWIKAQKAYIEALNGWLLKWLLQEREETPDGVAPFSPSRIGAPGAFIIANDWYHNMDAICEAEVIDSMQTFAINIHRLWETQDEEQRQKLKADYLSRDFARRLRSLQKENGMHGQAHVPISNGNEASHPEHKISLDAMKRRLDEERAKHEETIIQLQQATASNLRRGLVPIFQALENFSSETLKGYEGVRISNDGVGT
ncbi:unnamed protein product [Musa acuminata subsp. malaccensis]|uniref:(wild Malaysian banana) hypothetical protein n=1 Tax=Musa acuminata subsp. malaccensis TaxID=214687 RepID=A0A8D7AJY3_MUSAM|nr:unnamed protein product [Musa acuminata subsp. malaccensis]